MNWIQALDQNLSNWQAAFNEAKPQEWYFTGESGEWSANTCLDHIITSNETYFQILEAVLKGTYNGGFWTKLKFMAKPMGRMLKKSIDPANQKKNKTFKVFEPTGKAKGEDLIQKLAENHERLKPLIQKVLNKKLEGTIIASPASNMVVYSLEDAFSIIVLHEQRHLFQAKTSIQTFRLMMALMGNFGKKIISE